MPAKRYQYRYTRRGPSSARGGHSSTGSLEADVALAVSKARQGEVVSAADYLESKAAECGGKRAVEMLLTAAQFLDATNPNRAKSILEKALTLDPQSGVAHLSLSIVLSNLGDARLSVSHLKEAVQLPLTPSQKILASVMLSKYGLLAPALEMAKEAYSLSGRPISDASNCLDIALQVADWDFVEELIKSLRSAHEKGLIEKTNQATKTNILWCDDEEINIKVIEAWSRRSFPKVAEPNRKIESNPVGRRLRIGYLSSDFRAHPTAWLVNGLIKNHDKSRFELFMYCSGWDDGSEVRKELISNFEVVRSVSELDDAAAAKLIASDKLDILIELNGPTKSNRMGILAERPAPIQICYLGWPGSAGGRFVDYIIADDYVVPQEKAGLYPEKIIWLSGTYQANDYPDRGSQPPLRKSDFGLTADGLVLGAFNSINKVRREVWAAWMEILKSSPDAILWLLDPGPDARENLARETRRFGIELDRIVIAPKVGHDQHLRRLAVCDLMLDSWPVGGHTTTADALAAGVPVLAIQGKNFSSRVGGSLLRAAGLDQFVTQGTKEYVALAVELLSNRKVLTGLKTAISESIKNSRLFNARATTEEIEMAYEALVIDLWESQRA